MECDFVTPNERKREARSAKGFTDIKSCVDQSKMYRRTRKMVRDTFMQRIDLIPKEPELGRVGADLS